VKELTPFRHEDVSNNESGFKCYLIPVSPKISEDCSSYPKFHETKEMLEKYITSPFGEPSVIQEQPTAECLELSNFIDA
jgi:hypothetical protein